MKTFRTIVASFFLLYFFLTTSALAESVGRATTQVLLESTPYSVGSSTMNTSSAKNVPTAKGAATETYSLNVLPDVELVVGYFACVYYTNPCTPAPRVASVTTQPTHGAYHWATESITFPPSSQCSNALTQETSVLYYTWNDTGDISQDIISVNNLCGDSLNGEINYTTNIIIKPIIQSSDCPTE